MPPNFDPHLSDPPWHQLRRCRFECFCDGRIDAMEMLKRHFPLAFIHLCWKHAKRNVAKRYHHTGFKQTIKNTTEMIAFTPPMLFHLCCEIFLESLIESGQHFISHHSTPRWLIDRNRLCLVRTLGFKFSTLRGRIFNLCPSGGGGELAQGRHLVRFN